jgi:TldD protein
MGRRSTPVGRAGVGSHLVDEEMAPFSFARTAQSMSRSRREFVKLASSAAAAAGAMVVLPRRAIALVDPRRPIWAAFEDVVVGDFDAKAIAGLALDAARAAGASFADVRVDRQMQQTIGIVDRDGGNVDYKERIGIGVRVIADGQWGFAGSDIVTPDAVADTARRAVHQAQVNAKGRRTPVALVPTTVVADGRWATPVRTDPFAVAVGDQQEALLAGANAAFAVGPGVKRAVLVADFLRVDRVFASSEGSRLSQSFSYAFPSAQVDANAGGGSRMAVAEPKGFDWMTAGYEAVSEANLAVTMRAAAEEALRDSKRPAGPPARSVDVGRYELVVCPRMMWGLVNGTIVRALGMERALGKRAGFEGTTYASPPASALGKMQLGAPLLTVRGDRTAPGGLMTVGWDDEGVKPEEFALVDGGTITDYLALRENVPAMASWYESRGVPVRAHGVAAVAGWGEPREHVPNMTVAPGREDITVDEMIKDVKKGIYFAAAGGATTDFGMLNAFGHGSDAQEIRDGKLVGRLDNVGIQFTTQPFWKGLVAVGGAKSVESFHDGYPQFFLCRSVSSVPARFREVNVVNTGRTQ